MTTLSVLLSRAKGMYSSSRAEHSKYFFKTGPGQYGEGDIFWGLSVPEVRKLAKEYQHLDLTEVTLLLENEIHELRLLGLSILVEKYQKAKTDSERRSVYQFYLDHRTAANNWDLVDLSVYKIMGDFMVRYPSERTILYQFIKSDNLWERRLAMVATLAFIRKGESKDVLRLAEIIINDKEDLMHKAGGWMLRELGKKDESALCTFLNEHSGLMPRTMLRYAIEKFPEMKRKEYMQRKKQFNSD